MDRPIVYTSEQGRSVDFLFAQRATMIGLAKLSQAAFGGNTVVRGLPVTPNSPAALNVLVGIGEIYSMTAVDATTWGSLPADTTDMILKQGLNMAAQTISTPAPTTSGFSIAYLIEAQYQDQDTTTAVLPFFNSANPQIPLNGQGGSGAPLPTERQGVCVIQAKAGTAATTGTQVTPTVDSGWTALAVVTVANGQSTVTSGNISVPAGVPQVTSLLQMMQTGSPGYAVDTSTTANQIALSLTPALTAYTDGQEITFKAANNNTGPCTINAGGGSVNLVGVAGALQGGEIVAGSQYTALYSASLGELVLNSQTGGAEQINPATKPLHAMQLGQATGRLINVQTFAASGTYTPTAGMTSVVIKVQGGGGAGAGITIPSSGNASLGSPGGSGAYGEGRFLAAAIGASQAVTIGAAGIAAAGSAGGNGGTSSVGTLISAPGGVGGSMLNNTVPPNVNSNGSASSAPVGANIFACVGGSQGYSLAQSATFMYGGAGSSSLLGPATGIVPLNTGGTSASNLGCGGSGTAGGSGSGVLAGGFGSKGYVEIWEYS